MLCLVGFVLVILGFACTTPLTPNIWSLIQLLHTKLFFLYLLNKMVHFWSVCVSPIICHGSWVRPWPMLHEECFMCRHTRSTSVPHKCAKMPFVIESFTGTQISHCSNKFRKHGQHGCYVFFFWQHWPGAYKKWYILFVGTMNCGYSSAIWCHSYFADHAWL